MLPDFVDSMLHCFMLIGLCLYGLRHDTLPNTRVFACACHLVSFYILIGLLSDNPKSACPGAGVWSKVEPLIEGQTFSMEQLNQE